MFFRPCLSIQLYSSNWYCSRTSPTYTSLLQTVLLVLTIPSFIQYSPFIIIPTLNFQSVRRFDCNSVSPRLPTNSTDTSHYARNRLRMHRCPPKTCLATSENSHLWSSSRTRARFFALFPLIDDNVICIKIDGKYMDEWKKGANRVELNSV